MRLSDMIFLLGTSWAGLGLAITGALKIIPEPATKAFFEVRAMTAERVGDTAIINLDRTIHAPITMGFSVRVMEETDTGGWRQFCQMEALPFEYQPDAVLPDVIDLAWWTHDKCPTLPDAPARIITTWTPADPAMRPLTKMAEVRP